MKKDRNCGCGSATPYPVYQMQTPMIPMNPMMMPNQMFQGSIPAGMMQNIPNGMNNMNFQSTGIEQQINNLSSQVSNLERRVSNLENMMGSSNIGTNYNTSNFQMM